MATETIPKTYVELSEDEKVRVALDAVNQNQADAGVTQGIPFETLMSDPRFYGAVIILLLLALVVKPSRHT